MTAFDVSGEAYDRFMGRYSLPLGLVFADFAGVRPGMRALDVGCGPGALTRELVRRLGAGRVAAADPAPSFVAAHLERFPEVDAQQAPAERLPWADGEFDAALAQLVLSFVDDGPAAIAEMQRVVRPGGVVAACMWDAHGMEMLRVFWREALELDPDAPTERWMPYRTEPELRDVFERVGFDEVASSPLDVIAGYDGFDEFWSALLGRVGPAGAYLATLGEARGGELRDRVRGALGNPSGSFRLPARAWAVRGTVPR